MAADTTPTLTAAQSGPRDQIRAKDKKK